MALELDPPQPPIYRLSSTCNRHPDESFTGFCPSCLRERLSSLESPSTTSTTHRNSTSTISSSLKSIFSRPSASDLELRRCKSFACGRAGDGAGGFPSFEPQRRSCDVRGRGNAWSLFGRDGGGEIEVVEDEITAVDPGMSCEIERGGDEGEVKPMKEHIDLESQAKKPPPPPPAKDLAGTFWLAASVFSKKVQNWRRKQKMKKIKKQEEKADAPKTSRRFCESQSEIAVDAFGRRSCDFAPRFSLDAGRFSFDDPRYSIDEPRASWDGYMLGGGGGGRSLLSRVPPMLAVVEDAPTPAIQRSDGQIPVEEDFAIPGGSAQTKDYYSDTSSRSRRRSLDRSLSVKKVNVEVNELRPLSNARVSPAGSSEFFRDWSSSSLKEDRSESFESTNRADSSHNLPPRKKSNMWSKARNIWGLINRRSSSSSREGVNVDNVVERSLSESWPELRSNGNTNGLANGRLFRSNSNASSRNPINGSMRRNGKEKKKEDFVLERNRSAKYSPRDVDNGMLRFYLAPISGSRRGLTENSKGNSSSQSFTRSVVGLY